MDHQPAARTTTRKPKPSQPVRVEYLSDLFAERPFTWWLRGDEYLWEDMKRDFESVPMPETPKAIISLVKTAFKRHTGRPLSYRWRIYIEAYAHGGMSSGQVSAEYWREKVIPLLCARLKPELAIELPEPFRWYWHSRQNMTPGQYMDYLRSHGIDPSVFKYGQ